MPSGSRRGSLKPERDRRVRGPRFGGQPIAQCLEFGVGPQRVEAGATGRKNAEPAPDQRLQLGQRRIALAEHRVHDGLVVDQEAIARTFGAQGAHPFEAGVALLRWRRRRRGREAPRGRAGRRRERRCRGAAQGGWMRSCCIFLTDGAARLHFEVRNPPPVASATADRASAVLTEVASAAAQRGERSTTPPRRVEPLGRSADRPSVSSLRGA